MVSAGGVYGSACGVHEHVPLSTVVDGYVFLYSEYVLVGRTYDTAALEVELFYAVRHPSNYACHGEYGRVYLLRQAYHLIYESAVKVYVGADGLLRLTVLRHALYAFLLEQT